MREKQLLNGNLMPVPAFGTAAIGAWQEDSDLVFQSVLHALQAGYRHIDTASVYGNERSVGKAISESGVPRSEIFLTTKVWSTEQGYEATKAALQRSLERLGLDCVDLYLVHWPKPSQTMSTWRAMEELHDAGKIKNAGVSNFRRQDIEELWENSSLRPVCNQIELHPYFQQSELRDYLNEKGIAVVAWSPLGTGSWNSIKAEEKPLADSTIAKIAKAHHVSPAQVTLRWNLQLGIVPIPKSENPERIEQNLQIFDFELSDTEMSEIAALDKNTRLGGDPNNTGPMDEIAVPN